MNNICRSLLKFLYFSMNLIKTWIDLVVDFPSMNPKFVNQKSNPAQLLLKKSEQIRFFFDDILWWYPVHHHPFWGFPCVLDLGLRRVKTEQTQNLFSW